MKFVYIVMRGEGYKEPLMVCSNETTATNQVNLNARVIHLIDPETEPLDFDGTLTRYGWANRIWWQKEVLYD